MLTKEQLSAAHSTTPVTVTEASAGSGKTRTLVERINWLLNQQVAPPNICVVTFTSAAAKVIQERAHTTQLGYTGTLHALMLRLLRHHGHLISLPAELTVMDETEADTMLLGIAGRLKVKASMKELKKWVTACLETPIGIAKSTPPPAIVAAEFVRHQKQTGELSYDSLLVLGLKLIRQHPETAPFRHILCDESQDNATIDWQIYAAMKPETRFYVGDSRQAIYGFRGSDVKGFMALEGDQHPLTVNYRSSLHVIAAANRIAAKMEHKTAPAQAREDAPPGAVTVTGYQTAAEEINAVGGLVMKAIAAQQTVAILLRTNRAADIFRNALAAMGLPVAQVKPVGTAPDEKLGLALLRAMNAPNNDRLLLKWLEERDGKASATKLQKQAEADMTSVATVANMPELADTILGEPDDALTLAAQFGAPKAAGFWLHSLAQQVPMPAQLGDLLLEAQRKPEDAVDDTDAPVIVSTIHHMKGREVDVVILPAMEDESMPGNKTGDDEQEERRIFYVAVTRAKEACHISHAATRPDDWQKWKTNTRTLSRFAKDLQ